MFRHLHGSQTVGVKWKSNVLMALFFCLAAPLFSQNLTVNLTAQEPSCNGFTNGVVTANASGGNGNYSYQWNTGADGQQIVGGAGNYTVTVTDGNGLTGTANVDLAQPTAVMASISNTGSVCTNPGDITVNVSGGAGGYTYNWSNGSTAATQSGLEPGNYFVTVTDGTGCATTASTTVFGLLDVSLNIINVTCFNGCDASIEAIISGGTAPYSFQWSNGVTTQVNPDLLPGTYSVTVTDGNGCQVVETATVSNGVTINVQANATNASCSDGADGSATFTATGGAAPYTFVVGGGFDADNLMPGTYTVTATDAQGCQGSTTFTIGGGSNLNVTVTNDYECGDATGSATATVAGGSGNYTYAWSTGASTATITGLAPNATYSVTVTDNTSGCTGTGSTFIAAIDNITVNIASMDPTCNGFTNGTATATAMGGDGNYVYNWSTGATTRTIDGLGAGTYSVTVSDAQGCGGTANVTLNQPDALSVTFNSTNATCEASMSGTATAQPVGGTAPYTYEWTTGSNNATISGLGAGTYGVTVTDINGCTINGMVAITAPASDLSVNVMGTDVSCNGDTNGSATAQPMNGSGNYAYAWSNGATTATITGLAAGTYSVTVSDGDCTASGSVTIGEPAAVNVTATVTGGGGCTASSGSVTVTASGGTAPYTFAYSNGASGATVDLPAGTYTVTATDANGCTATTSVTVAGSNGISVTVETTNANCVGSDVGTATANVSGGNGPYTYNWSNGGTTQTITGLAAGTYTVTVTSADGCQAAGVGVINNASAVNVEIIASSNVACADDATGSASALATGGMAPYTYNWSDGQTGATAFGLVAGTYTVTATDANGCSDTATVTIGTDSDLEVEVLVWNPECEDEGNGKIMAMPEGGTAPYTYVWSTGAVTQAILNLSAGTYCVTVTDARGCMVSGCADLESVPNPNVSIQVLSPVGASGNGGSLQALPTGGSAPYAFNWNNGRNTPVISGLSPGRYSVTVTDNSLCQGVSEIILSGPGNISGNVFNDLNANGVRDPGEPGVANIGARLLGENVAGFNVDLTVRTNAAGNYLFEDLDGGNYRVRFTNIPNGFSFSPTGNSANPALNSSVTNPDLGETNTFSYQSNSFVENVNAGIYRGGGRLVEDVNISVDVMSNGSVEVSWEIPAIVSNFAFIVERSDDGGETFKVVGDAATTIEADAMMVYRFVDEAPKRGRAYYRVGYVTTTELEYSNTSEAMLSMPDFAMVYPNPVTNEVMVELFSALSTDARVQLMDTSGRIIKTKRLASGDMHERVNLEDLNPGIYFIRVVRQDDAEPTLIRIVKK